MKYYVVNDMKSSTREAFVITENEWTEVSNNYSGYYIEKIFDSASEAEKFCKDFNSYVDVPDEALSCCSNGCVMTACEYAMWNGQCAYQGT